MVDSRSRAARILVVDDHVQSIQMLGEMLDQFGFEIVQATSGDQALRSVAERAPDLMLLDVMMHDIDGFEVCRRLREKPEWKDIPVIFLSAANDKSSIVRALETGGVDYVTKPFNRAELISRVRTHLALKAARDELRQLAEDKDELIGILTHDLKSHLGGMQMSARLLHDRVGTLHDARLGQMAGNILEATDRMYAFVKEYLANAAIAGDVTLKLESVSLSEVAAFAVERYADIAKRKDISLHFEGGTDDALVRADRAALFQVLDNLVSNALKFSPYGRNVWVSVEGSEWGECRVRDEGPGFTEEDKSRMFHRYRRLSALPTAGEPSTGLGLSIIKKLVDAMQGQVRCESTAGQGTTFILRLPYAPAAVN